MRGLKTIITIILLLLLSTAAYSQEEPATANEQTGSAQEKAAATKEDNLLPFQKEGWQFLVAPYLWFAGAHLDLSHQGQFSGTTVANIPWYDVVPLIFSELWGGAGRVEVWNGRWGVFSDTTFLYLSDSVSAGGARTLELNPRRFPVTIPIRLELSGDMKIWSRLLWQDVGARYLVGTVPLNADKPLPVLTCELLGGLRYTYYNQDVSLGLDSTLTGPYGKEQITRGGNFFSDVQMSIPQPMIGLRLGLWFTPKLNLIVKADCGGFGFVAYNAVDSVIEGLVGYQVYKNIRIYGGYSARYISAGFGSTKDIAIHGWFQGPMLGTVFSF
jgi:hypothetical protein